MQTTFNSNHKIMNPKTAIKILLGIFGAVLIFHFGILLKFIPYEITWGGRLNSDEEMYAFETVSIVINLFLVLLLLIKGAYMKAFIPLKIVDILLWGFLVLFVLNTIGNLFAKTTFEKFFTVITLGAVVLLWIILKSKKDAK